MSPRESAFEHIANALQIAKLVELRFPNGEPVTFERDEYDALMRRLNAAAESLKRTS